MIALLLAADTKQNSGSLASMLPLLLIMFGAMYFLVIRPQKKRQAAASALNKALGEGDEVMTTSGIYGFINAIDGDMVWLEIADNVEIRVSKGAIARRVDPVTEPAGGEPTATTDAPAGDGGDADKK